MTLHNAPPVWAGGLGGLQTNGGPTLIWYCNHAPSTFHLPASNRFTSLQSPRRCVPRADCCYFACRRQDRLLPSRLSREQSSMMHDSVSRHLSSPVCYCRRVPEPQPRTGSKLKHRRGTIPNTNYAWSTSYWLNRRRDSLLANNVMTSRICTLTRCRLHETEE